VTVARHHTDLAHAFAQFKRSFQHRWRGLRTTDDFQQFHDVRRAEEMQAQHLSRAARRSGDGIDIQRRGVARHQGLGLQHTIEFTKDLLLELKILVHRFNHQIDISDRHVIRCRTDPCDSPVGLRLIDPPLTHVMRTGIGHCLQRLLEHLRIGVDPLH